MTFNTKRGAALKRAMPILLLAAFLQACGGGGGSDDSADDGPDYIQEFLGAWKDPDTTCYPLTDEIFAKGFGIELTNTSANQSVHVYSDSSCSLDETKITASYTLAHAQTSLGGRSNVVKLDLKFTGVTAVRNGSATTVSQETLDELSVDADFKELVDIVDDKLYSGDWDTLDEQGYPTAIDADYYFTR